MPNVDSLVQDGIAAIKAGHMDEARRALMKAVELDEQSEQGWLWLSACVESTEEQQICLENALSINPKSEKARKGLAAIAQKTGKPSSALSAPTPSTPAAPAPTAAPDPFAGNFDSNPFAGTGFDSNPYGSANNSDMAVKGSWDTFGSESAAPAGGWNPFGADDRPEPAASPAGSDPASPSSVDWNRGNKGAAYGSGKDVQLPSSDEYDSWVSGLPLGGAKDASGSDANAPFGSTGAFGSFDDAPDPFGGTPQASAGPFGSPADSANAAGPFDSFDFSSTPTSEDAGPSAFDFGSTSDAFSGPFSSSSSSFDSAADPFGPSSPRTSRTETPQPGTPFGSTAGKSSAPSQSSRSRSGGDLFSPEAAQRDSAGRGGGNTPFSVSPEDSVDDLFQNVPSRGKKAAASSANAGTFGDVKPRVLTSNQAARKSAPRLSPTQQAFFKAIPEEIQAKGGGRTDVRLMATLVVLAILNMMSFAFLLLNLTKH